MDVRNALKNIICILLILAGICGFVMIFLIVRSRNEAVNVSRILTIASAVMIFIYSLINLLCGVIALFRRIPRKAVRVRPFVQVSVILGILQIIVSAYNGILIPHLIILGVAGVLIPELFFLLIGPSLRQR